MKKILLGILTLTLLVGCNAKIDYTPDFFTKLYSLNFFELNSPTKIKLSKTEKLVEKFVLGLAAGKCSKVIKYTTGNARESVQATIDSGCEPYITMVSEVMCTTNENKAKCTCSEKRDGMEMKYLYDLVRINGKWKIENFEKDFDMGDIDFDGEGVDESVPKSEENSK